VPSVDHDVVDTSTLWDNVDLVRAMCFKQSRRFILELESELVRLLEAPRGAILRIDAQSSWYRSLAKKVSARFRVVMKDTNAWGKAKIDFEGSAESRLPLPAQAFVAPSWTGRPPETWRTTLPKAVAKKPYLEMVMTPAHDFDQYGSVDSDDRSVLISNDSALPSKRQLPCDMWEMPDDWTFRSGNHTEGSMVLTIDLERDSSGKSVCIALVSDAHAAAAPLQRLLHHDVGEDVEDSIDKEEDPYVIMLDPCMSQNCWIVEFGRASKLTRGLSQGQRVAPWSGEHKSTIWVALMENDDGRLQIEIGVDCFPWRRLFKARLSAGCSKFNRFAMAALSKSSQNANGITMQSLKVEHGLCCDVAARDHIVFLTWFAARGSRPDGVDGSNVSAWIPRPSSGSNLSDDDDVEHVLAICPNASAAAELAVLAEKAGWETCCMANAPVDGIDVTSAGGDDAAGSPLSASLFVAAVAATANEALRRRAKEAGKLDNEAALDLALCEFVLGSDTEEQVPCGSNEIVEGSTQPSIYELLGTGLRRGDRSNQVTLQNSGVAPRSSERLNPHAVPFEPSQPLHKVMDWDWEEDRDDNNWQTLQEGSLWDAQGEHEDRYDHYESHQTQWPATSTVTVARHGKDWEEDRDDSNWHAVQEDDLWNDQGENEDHYDHYNSRQTQWPSNSEVKVARYGKDKRLDTSPPSYASSNGRSEHHRDQWQETTASGYDRDKWEYNQQEYKTAHKNRYEQWDDNAAYEAEHWRDRPHESATSTGSRSSWKDTRKPAVKNNEEQWEEPDTRYIGVIKFYFEHREYGFIDCDEVVQAFGTDTYVSKEFIGGFKNGDRVSFCVTLVKGRPQARDLQQADRHDSEYRKDEASDWKAQRWRNETWDTRGREKWDKQDWDRDTKKDEGWKASDWSSERPHSAAGTDQWNLDKQRKGQNGKARWQEEEHDDRWRTAQEEYDGSWRKSDSKSFHGREDSNVTRDVPYREPNTASSSAALDMDPAPSKRPGFVDRAFCRVAVEGHLLRSRRGDQPRKRATENLEVEANYLDQSLQQSSEHSSEEALTEDSEEETTHVDQPPPQPSNTGAETVEQAIPDKCDACGNEFLSDEIYCRICGLRCEARAEAAAFAELLPKRLQ